MKPFYLRHTGDRHLLVRYADGLGAELDFTGYFEQRPGAVTSPLEAEHLFEQAHLDHGVLTWPTDYYIDPALLRLWCQHGRVLPEAETQKAIAM